MTQSYTIKHLHIVQISIPHPTLSSSNQQLDHEKKRAIHSTDQLEIHKSIYSSDIYHPSHVNSPTPVQTTTNSELLNAVHHHLQLGEDGLSRGDSDVTARLVLSVDDLAVVDDKSVTASALAKGPAELLGESGLRVGEEELREGGVS